MRGVEIAGCGQLRTLLVCTIAATVVGCATNAGGYRTEETVSARLMEMSESEVAMRMGAPTDKTVLSDGKVLWSYRDDAEGLTGGECTVSMVIEGGEVVSANVVARDRSFVSFPMGSCQNLIGNLD